jgi:hypothetical protein
MTILTDAELIAAAAGYADRVLAEVGDAGFRGILDVTDRAQLAKVMASAHVLAMWATELVELATPGVRTLLDNDRLSELRRDLEGMHQAADTLFGVVDQLDPSVVDALPESVGRAV